MSNGKIEIKNSSLYTIEVNGIPDLIKLDLTDMSLPAKIMEMINKCNEIEENVTKKIKEIDHEEDKEVIVVDAFLDGFSVKAQKTVNVLNESYNELRKVVDAFLGEGVCMAIFGESNYYNMFNDLFTALKPELDKAMKKGNMSIKNMQKSLGDKYKPKTKKVI